MRRWVVLVLAVALALPVAVWAGSLADVNMPDEVVVSGKTLKLNGMGLRKKLWIKVYVAGLYLEETTANAEQAISSEETKRVVMHFMTNKATKSKMDDAWMEGFEANSPREFPGLKARVEQLISFFGDMKDGDEIVFTFEPGGGVTAELNGQVKGTIEGDDFGRALLRVWLGSSPPTEDLKEGLLGK